MARVRVLPFILVATLSVALFAACGDDSKSSTASSSSSSSGGGGGVTVSSAAGGTTVAVDAGDTKGTDAPETLTVNPATAKAGDVSFTVKNSGTIDHEVVVLKTDTPFDKLEVGKEEADKVDESTSQGETGDPALKPGETRTFTIKGLAAGKYVLVCNIAKHYALGMRAAFTVS